MSFIKLGAGAGENEVPCGHTLIKHVDRCTANSAMTHFENKEGLGQTCVLRFSAQYLLSCYVSNMHHGYCSAWSLEELKRNTSSFV